MPLFEQTDRPMKLTTPLGPNALVLVGLEGREAISQMFYFELQTAWVDNSKLLRRKRPRLLHPRQERPRLRARSPCARRTTTRTCHRTFSKPFARRPKRSFTPSA